MYRRSLLTLAFFSAGAVALNFPSAARADGTYRISGPVTHANLAIYFVHGKSTGGPVPATLQEAMAAGSVGVHETSNVNQLEIENTGDAEVFVQSGDIVKGGKQDRVLMVSLILPPRSGRIPIASFCVEQGRWSARGREDARKFASADAAVPSREAKLAMKAPTPALSGARPVAMETRERQQAVWRSVATTQAKLSDSVGQPVAAPASRSSLQLSLENEGLKEARGAYIDALKAAGEKESDIVGYVFAVNGNLNSADVYPSNGLFKKMWPKLLAASATEAIGDKAGNVEALPATDAVLAFLHAAEQGKPTEKELTQTVKLETRDTDKSVYTATSRAHGDWVHRNYLAK